MVQDPTQPNVQFVVEQGGKIRVVRDGALLPVDFLDLTTLVLSGGERGLLGLAFAPDYATSRRFFVNYTRQTDGHTVDFTVPAVGVRSGRGHSRVPFRPALARR